MSTAVPRKDQRIEFRISSQDRDLLAQAADAEGTDLSGFAMENLRIAAQRVLADRRNFALSPVEAELWEQLNERPARDLPGLRALLSRPSPWVD